MKTREELREQLEKILMIMDDRGFQTYMVSMNRKEIELVMDMIITQDERVGQMKDEYGAGYEAGYKQALLDAIRKLKEMTKDGGRYAPVRIDGVP